MGRYSERGTPAATAGSVPCKILAALALAAVLAWLLWKLHLVCAMPGIEARELANVTAIRQLRDDSFNTLAAYPQNIYLYGALQAWLLSWLPGWNDVLLNRLFSLACMLGSAIPLLAAAKRMNSLAGGCTRPGAWVLPLGCYLLPFLIEIPFSLGTPNYLGLLLANSVLWISLCSFRGKDVLAGLLLVGCFLTKQYFLLAALYVVLYNLLLCNSLRKAALHTAVTGAVALGGCALCFVSDQVFYSFVHHIVDANCAKKRALQKFCAYSLYVLPMVLPAVGVGAKLLLRHRRGFAGRFLAPLRENMRSRVYLCVLANVGLTALVLVKVGGHSGALGQLYFTQLLTPPLLLLCFLLQQRGEPAVRGGATSLLLLAGVAWYAAGALREERAAMQTQPQALAVYAADIQRGSTVRGSCMTALYDAAHGLAITENGQQQYMDTVWQEGKGVEWAHERLKPYLQKNKAAREELLEGLRAGRWQVVYTDGCTYMPDDARKELKARYAATASLPFAFPGFKTELVRWERLGPQGDKS